MKDEIYAGLKNALERGSSLDEAVESFVNSGYNIDEVHEAASMLTQGATNITSSSQNEKLSSNEPSATTEPIKKSQEIQSPQSPSIPIKPKSSRRKWIIILFVTVIILLLGIVSLLIFSNSVIGFLKGLLG